MAEMLRAAAGGSMQARAPPYTTVTTASTPKALAVSPGRVEQRHSSPTHPAAASAAPRDVTAGRGRGRRRNHPSSR